MKLLKHPLYCPFSCQWIYFILSLSISSFGLAWAVLLFQKLIFFVFQVHRACSKFNTRFWRFSSADSGWFVKKCYHSSLKMSALYSFSWIFPMRLFDFLRDLIHVIFIEMRLSDCLRSTLYCIGCKVSSIQNEMAIVLFGCFYFIIIVILGVCVCLIHSLFPSFRWEWPIWIKPHVHFQFEQWHILSITIY